MSNMRPTHTPRADATTLERELDVLASIYRRAIDAYEARKGAHPGAPDARKEIDGSGKTIIPK
jgi:hypothetical protein